jgi:hypothetical protein
MTEHLFAALGNDFNEFFDGASGAVVVGKGVITQPVFSLNDCLN